MTKGVHAGDGLELPRQLDQMTDAPFNGVERLPCPRLIQWCLTEQTDTKLQRAERLAPFVCGHVLVK